MKRFKHILIKPSFIFVAYIFLSSIFANSHYASSSLISPSKNDVISQSLSLNIPDSSLIEEFSFLIKDFQMNHQGELKNLNISVRMRYMSNIQAKDYPDVRLIAKDIENLLSNYPNKKEYWEIVNKKITSMVLDRYPVVINVVSEIQVSAAKLNTYMVTSTVTRKRTNRNIVKNKLSQRNK